MLEDLNLGDWPLEDSFKHVSNFLDSMPSNSQDTEPERSIRTPSRKGRPRGRPPRRPRGHTISSRQTAREIDTAPSITSNSDSDASTTQLTSDVDQGATQVNQHYGLRRNREPRYRCGTCGFRDCTCVVVLNKSPTIPLGPVKAPVYPKPQRFIHNGKLLVSRVVIRAEKTYTV